MKTDYPASWRWDEIVCEEIDGIQLRASWICNEIESIQKDIDTIKSIIIEYIKPEKIIEEVKINE